MLVAFGAAVGSAPEAGYDGSPWRSLYARVLLSGILAPAAMSRQWGLKDRREDAREHNGQRERRDERDEEGRNTLADPAGHDGADGCFAVVAFIVPSGPRWPCRRPATGVIARCYRSVMRSDLANSSHNRTLARLAQGRWDLVALTVGFVPATAKSRRAASGEHSGCWAALHTPHDAGATPRLPGLPALAQGGRLRSHAIGAPAGDHRRH